MSTLSSFYGFDKDTVGNGKRKRVDPSGSAHGKGISQQAKGVCAG